jgi:hypothetical protein
MGGHGCPKDDDHWASGDAHIVLGSGGIR